MNNTEELKRRLAKEYAVTELDTRDAYAVEWTVAAMSSNEEWKEDKKIEQAVLIIIKDTHCEFISNPPTDEQAELYSIMAFRIARKLAATQPEAGERKFTLEDLIDAYGSGYNKAGAEWQDSEHSKPDDEPTMGQYFKDKFNIDLKDI